MTDGQARLMGEMAGKAFAEKIIKWLESGNPHRMTMVGAEWLVKKFGEAIGRGIAKQQKS